MFAPSGFFVLRTPLLPFAELATWNDGVAAEDRAELRRRLAAMIERPEVREAIFVASPSLEDSLPIWTREPESERGQKVERALVRYLARMAGRATPFAGGSVAPIYGPDPSRGSGRSATSGT